MQYILTEEEYRKLTPTSYLTNEKAKVERLNNKIMELSNHTCTSNKSTRSVTFYATLALSEHLVQILAPRINSIQDNLEPYGV